jgi:hypothetical protein
MPNAPTKWRKGLAVLLALLAFGAFVWLNIRTAMSFPPWLDEVMQGDAGVNLYLGKGWVTTAWPSQSQHEFWAANNPLYTFLVYLWVRIFSLSPVAVRSLNYVLAGGIAWLIADTCKRAGFIRARWAQALLALLLVCDQAFTFVYRRGRPDTITMLVVVLLFRVYVTVGASPRRRLLLFLCALPMLPAGLHTIPYTALLLCVDYCVTRKLRWADLRAIGSGCVAGGAILALVYLSQHALVAFASQTFVSGFNILGSALQAAMFRDSGSVGRLVNQLKGLSPPTLVATICQDAGSALLIAGLLICSVLFWRSKPSLLRTAALTGLLAAFLIPFGMVAAGRYAFYYAWMGAAPVAVAFTIVLEQSLREHRTLLFACGLAGATAAVLAGMPYELRSEVRSAPPGVYAAVEGEVRRASRRGDILYADPVFYYAAKQAGLEYICTCYAGGRGYRRMTDGERASVSLMMIDSGQERESIARLGGQWVREDGFVSPYGPSIVVLRRQAGMTGGK